jgi:hypothetical protein
MTTNETSSTSKAIKTSWFRRVVMGSVFAAVGLLTLGTVTTPAQAYWYHHGWYHPYYRYYHPHYGYYGWYGPAYYGPAYYGWGWHHGWRH